MWSCYRSRPCQAPSTPSIPATGEPGAAFPEATPADVHDAVHRRARALPRAASCRPGRARRVAARRRRAPARGRGRDRRGRRAETGLPEARLRGELERTAGQLEAFAAVVDGRRLRRRDHRHRRPRRQADPAARRAAHARPDRACRGVRRQQLPARLPTAGGDTASALAAGCPVIVKGHPSHPGTSAVVARELAAAAAERGLPGATFALLQSSGIEVGEALVDEPAIAAVGFTGSFAGGKALHDRAAAREQPDPRLRRDGQRQPDRRDRGRADRARRGDRGGPRDVGGRRSAGSCAPSRRRLRARGRGGRRIRRRPGGAAGRLRSAGAAQRAPARRADRSRRASSAGWPSPSTAPPRRAEPGFRSAPRRPRRGGRGARAPRAARGALRPGRAAARPTSRATSCSTHSCASKASSRGPSTRRRRTPTSSRCWRPR